MHKALLGRKVFERNQHLAEHEKAHSRCPDCNSPQVEPVLADFYAKTSKKADVRPM